MDAEGNFQEGHGYFCHSDQSPDPCLSVKKLNRVKKQTTGSDVTCRDDVQQKK